MEEGTTTPTQPNHLTTDLRLASVLLTELPEREFEVFPSPIPSIKAIRVFYPKEHAQDADKLIRDYTSGVLLVNLSAFFYNLKVLRDKIYQER